MSPYVYQAAAWPKLTWDTTALAGPLAAVRHRQGRLIGHMEALGFDRRREATLHALTEEVLKSSEIEGEKLDPEQVRSSIARRLGIDIGALTHADRDVEGVVEMMLDATENYSAPLTAERLFGWHADLFPTGRSGGTKITVGAWRTGEAGPMQVVSGPIGQEHVHFEAPDAARVPAEMNSFLDWFESSRELDQVICAAVAHLWFVTIHPFEDGNGRIARTIADMALARSEKTPQRYYSMSSQIRTERKAYYDMLEKTQKGDTDITPWISWFLGCLDRAIASADTMLASILRKARFWQAHAGDPLNERQRKVVNRLMDGFQGKLTSSKYASLAKCSQDTAARDIADLCDKSILAREPAGGRSTSFTIIMNVSDALEAVARWTSAYADRAVTTGGEIRSPTELAEQATRIKAIAGEIAEIAKAPAAPGLYRAFESKLGALQALGFSPDAQLITAVVRSITYR